MIFVWRRVWDMKPPRFLSFMILTILAVVVASGVLDMVHDTKENWNALILFEYAFNAFQNYY